MNIFDQYRAHRNIQEAESMQAYMKGKFEFLGVKRPLRNELQRDFIREKKKEKLIDNDFIRECWTQPEREFQYLGMDYFRSVIRYAGPQDLELMRSLIIEKSWWDTVDFIASNLVGEVVKNYPELKENLFPWITDHNMWLRRTTLLFQLKYKDDTDIHFLEQAIKSNLGSSEFFINKAIGWSLRQYSKHNPEWVRAFIQQVKLAPLSLREASKYL